jgi:TRAP-type C4-dicarboxylate transport system permease small subunit
MTVVIIVTSFLNIVLRWFNTSLMFVDPLVRHLVFAMAFLGAVEATERSQNISIDILKRYLEAKNKDHLIGIINRVVYVFSILGCLWLASSAYGFVKIEMEYPRELFWGLNTGMAAAIIPFGFVFIAIKSLLKLLTYQGEQSA